jgi:hypothetical protein
MFDDAGAGHDKRFATKKMPQRRFSSARRQVKTLKIARSLGTTELKADSIAQPADSPPIAGLASHAIATNSQEWQKLLDIWAGFADYP